MYTVIVKFEAVLNKTEEFKSLVLKQAANSLEKETECYQFDVVQDEKLGNIFYLYELYTNRQAFDEHLKSAHFIEFDKLSASLVTNKEVWLGQLVAQ